jgi:hypothetical protein
MEDLLCPKHATLSHINQVLDVFILFSVHKIMFLHLHTALCMFPYQLLTVGEARPAKMADQEEFNHSIPVTQLTSSRRKNQYVDIHSLYGKGTPH